MERFINSITKSLAAENWFAALFMTLALPDICGALEEPDRPVGERYKDWFNRFLKLKYDPATMYESMLSSSSAVLAGLPQDIIEQWKSQPAMAATAFSAEDCYRLRCKCLHQGLPERMGNDRIHFTTPDPSGRMNFHKNSFNGVLQLSIDVFCIDVCNAVTEWLKEVHTDTNIQQRIEELIKIYGLDAKELPIVSYK